MEQLVNVFLGEQSIIMTVGKVWAHWIFIKNTKYSYAVYACNGES